HTAPVAAFKKRKLLNRVVIKLTYSFISLINAKVICVSQGVKNDLSLLYKIKNCRVINNFIDHQDLDKKTQNNSHNDRVFDYIFVGRLTKVKGCDVLIDALCDRSVFIKDNNINIAIIGDGDERKKLQGKIEKFGISSFVSFKGECENPYVYMKSAKYIIVPSYAEGFGLVVLEGLYLGADIIYSKCDFGPREIIDNYFSEQKKLGFSDPSLNRIESVAELSSIIKYTFNSRPFFLSHEKKKERVCKYFNKAKVASDICKFLND
ncbi:glycosyltransferase, partial [Candidatus Erwinia dacicola]|uniref:glycosyltransferase n=1 Tax=Candidatus Erwinia dacicola TaxID=252393 RepID=UPI0011D07E85